MSRPKRFDIPVRAGLDNLALSYHLHTDSAIRLHGGASQPEGQVDLPTPKAGHSTDGRRQLELQDERTVLPDASLMRRSHFEARRHEAPGVQFNRHFKLWVHSWGHNWATSWATLSSTRETSNLDMSQNSKQDLGQVLGLILGPQKLLLNCTPEALAGGCQSPPVVIGEAVEDPLHRLVRQRE